jgi:hypothetical protein
VSSSRAGTPPANLQGIWNAELRPAWSSNYTININTQMNHWAANSAGMPDCVAPLAELVAKMAVNGREVARELYGARGWVAHHNTDMWGWALPVGMGHGNPSWAIWMMGGVWLTHNLWDHYEFTPVHLTGECRQWSGRPRGLRGPLGGDGHRAHPRIVRQVAGGDRCAWRRCIEWRRIT